MNYKYRRKDESLHSRVIILSCCVCGSKIGPSFGDAISIDIVLEEYILYCCSVSCSTKAAINPLGYMNE